MWPRPRRSTGKPGPRQAWPAPRCSPPSRSTLRRLPPAGTGGPGRSTGTSGIRHISGTSSSARAAGTSFNLPFNVSWEPDLWGNIRRGVTASASTAQSLAANVGNARLLYQAELAQDYFGLHGNDGEADLLARTEASYEEYLTLTQNRFSAGVVSDLDVAQAESQLYDVQSQLMDLGVQRAAFEHAIAILIGKAPAELTIPPAALNMLRRRCRWVCRLNCWNEDRTSPERSGRWLRRTSRLEFRWRRSIQI